MPSINWEANTAPTKFRSFLEATQNKSMCQLVTFPTHVRGNILDVVLTDVSEKIMSLEPIGFIGGSDHTAISIDINYGAVINRTNDCIPDWSKADYNGLSNFYYNINWSEELYNKSADEAWLFFKDNINQGTDLYIPKKLRRENNKPPWYNSFVKKQVRRKQKLWDHYKANLTGSAFLSYKASEKKCKKLIINATKKV